MLKLASSFTAHDEALSYGVFLDNFDIHHSDYNRFACLFKLFEKRQNKGVQKLTHS